ncbi:MAG TPA: hypothetical protein VMG12_09860, partial [Polyangiaceae bacterium]|nr:hypothetical protein [Polyangiaceae bacterium]
SPRTDVFSAGVVLWEALVGQRLFYEPGLDRGDLLQALVLKPVLRPSRMRSDVPKAVDDVVKKALSRNPERRYQTALDFANALEAIGVAPIAVDLADLVAELCAERLAEKDALLRAGLAAAAEASATTPVPQAIVVPSPPSFSGMALSNRPRPLRGSRMAWAGAVLLAGSALWWTFDAMRASRASGSPSTLRAAAPPVAQGPSPQSPSTTALVASAEAIVHAPAPEVAAREPEVVDIPIITLSGVAAEERAEPTRRRASRPRSVDTSERPLASARGRVERRDGAPAAPANRARAHLTSPKLDVATRDCDPPTYMDAAGIRHFKKDCL